MNNRIRQVLLFVLTSFCLNAQNTVGVLSIDNEQVYSGYNLLYSHNQPNAYLLNNCGEIVHKWEGEEGYVPGNVAYIQPNGDIIKARRSTSSVADTIWAGGGGETVERLTWDNELLWSFTLNNDEYRLHHDLEVLDNGNVLMIAWHSIDSSLAVTYGRNPELLADKNLWGETIIEYNPILDSIVWQWDVFDHLVQDFDEAKVNYGVVAEHPELIDLNYDDNGHRDWLHVNAIDYNPVLDQIVLSVPHFDEMWIIDHSTTTAEAASHQGGNAGKGGDLLFRYGNPIAYNQGTEENQVSFFQHDVHWIKPNAQEGEDGFGQLAFFNNRVANGLSTVNTFTPSINNFNYQLENGVFLPVSFDETITHPDTITISSSSGLSSVQFLENGNVLVLAGRWGYAYELNSDRDLIWEYRVPFLGGQRVSQGDSIGINGNITFRIERYNTDYSAFEGRDLTPTEYLELNANTEFCNLSTSTNEVTINRDITIYPNPVNDRLEINTISNLKAVAIYNLHGQLIAQFDTNVSEIDLAKYSSGVYYLHFDLGTEIIIEKIVKVD